MGKSSIFPEKNKDFVFSVNETDVANVKENDTSAIIQPLNSRISPLTPNQVYDVSGRRLPHDAMLPRGIYIVKEGDTTRKIFVK